MKQCKAYGLGVEEAGDENWHVCVNNWNEAYDLLELMEAYVDGPMARVDWVEPHAQGGWLLANAEKGSRCIYVPSEYVRVMAGKQPVVDILEYNPKLTVEQVYGRKSCTRNPPSSLRAAGPSQASAANDSSGSPAARMLSA